MRKTSLYDLAPSMLVLAWSACGLLGCIEPSRTVLDARARDDAADGLDTTEPPGDTGVGDDVDSPDVPEVAGDTIEVECDENDDCELLEGGPECAVWVCASNRCKLAPDTDERPCEDGNACTISDFCRSGECQPGTTPKECEQPSVGFGCAANVCVPDKGCVPENKAAGTACDNGTGANVGSCSVGGFVPTDACDGDGRCKDRIPEATTTPSLADKWFMVYTNFATARSTTRAIVNVSPTSNSFDINAIWSNGANPLGTSTGGHVCADSTGLITANLTGAGSLNGRHLEGQLAILTSPLIDGVSLLLRMGQGTPEMVHGKYNYVQTTMVFGQDDPTTWRGHLVFEKGCLTFGLIFADPAVDTTGGYAYLPETTACLVPMTDADAGLVQLLTAVRPVVNDESVYPIFNRGAIGANGNILLMVKEAYPSAGGDRTPDYGTIVMVREPDSTVESGSLAGNWAYAFQSRTDTTARRDVGMVTWASGGVISPGSLSAMGTPTQMAQGWYATDVARTKMSQRVSLGSGIFHSGYFDPSRRFIVGWPVASSTSSSPVLLPLTPRGGGLLFMLKP